MTPVLATSLAIAVPLAIALILAAYFEHRAAKRESEQSVDD